MKERKPINSAASIRQRLLNLSRQTGEPFQLLLTRYAIERFLFRLSQSGHRDKFLLKGAVLFAVWTGEMHRPTRDLDLLGIGTPEDGRLLEIFSEICQVETEDGLTFLDHSISIERIREDQEYEGQRLAILVKLGNTRINLQVDIGFGDSVTPSPESITFPTILDMPAPSLNAYPMETVISEKLHAMVALGLANSRMKDFFDLWILCRTFPFSGTLLTRAIQSTFLRRGTELPFDAPVALSKTFSADPQKQTQWRAFLTRSSSSSGTIELVEVIEKLSDFLLSPLQAAQANLPFDRWWKGGEWQDSDGQ